ncbi:MAG: glycosyltransferase family 9 protein [Candidatus Accumulibacter sp.]|nr:glycosyltransferase family 9 protein [Accumulibacter sp.]
MNEEQRASQQVLAQRRVALCGDGDILRSMMAWLQEREFQIAAVVDHRAHGKLKAAYSDIPVLSPEGFAEHETPIVICRNESGGFAAEAQMLRRLGFFVLPYHALFDLKTAMPENIAASSGLAQRLRCGANFMAKIGKSILYDGLVFAAMILDFMVCLLASPKEHADLLLTILDDGLGDFVIRQDALRAFRTKYANRKVFLICEAAYCELAALDPFFTKILPLNRRIARHPWRRAKFLFTLRRTAFEEAISLLHMRLIARSEWVMKMSIAKHKIGMRNYHFRFPAEMRSVIDAPYTRLVDIANPGGHVLHVFAEFTRAVCQPDFRIAQPRLHFTAPARVRDAPYVVFALSATAPPRCWPAERFAALTDILDCPIVLLGNGDLGDRLGKTFIRHACRPERIINQINRTSLLEYVGEIANAALVLGQDSSALHIAAALGVPSIAAAAGGNYGGHAAGACNYPYFLPYPSDLPGGKCSPIAVTTPMDCFGCGHECKYPVEDCFVCLKMIRVEQVKVVLKDVAERLCLTSG